MEFFIKHIYFSRNTVNDQDNGLCIHSKKEIFICDNVHQAGRLIKLRLSFSPHHLTELRKNSSWWRLLAVV